MYLAFTCGLAAWLIWLFIHLMYIVEFQNRVLVFVQWGFEYLTFSRGARLITGAAESDLKERRAPVQIRGRPLRASHRPFKVMLYCFGAASGKS